MPEYRKQQQMLSEIPQNAEAAERFAADFARIFSAPSSPTNPNTLITLGKLEK